MAKNRTRITLAGIVLTAAGITGASYLNSRNQKTVEISSQPAITLNLDGRKEHIRKTLTNYLETFLSDYVLDFSPHSDEMRDNIKQYGGGEKGTKEVAKGYVDLYSICLDCAIKAVDKELTERDVDELSSRLVAQHKTMAKKTDLCLEHPAIVKGYRIWGRDKVERFRKVIAKNLEGNEKDYRGMYLRAFDTEAEMTAELEKQNEAEKILFESFKKSLENKGTGARLLGPAVIDAQQKKSRELNYRELKRFYGKLTSQIIILNSLNNLL